jgi:hypothetical protein
LRTTRLQTSDRRIDVRWASFDGRWIASADAPEGPTLGLGDSPHEAITAALESFGDDSGDDPVGSADDGCSH